MVFVLIVFITPKIGVTVIHPYTERNRVSLPKRYEDVIVEYNKRGMWDVNVWCAVGHGNWVSYNCFLTKEEAVAWAKIEENVQ